MQSPTCMISWSISFCCGLVRLEGAKSRSLSYFGHRRPLLPSSVSGVTSQGSNLGTSLIHLRDEFLVIRLLDKKIKNTNISV